MDLNSIERLSAKIDLLSVVIYTEIYKFIICCPNKSNRRYRTQNTHDRCVSKFEIKL